VATEGRYGAATRQ